MDEWSGQGDLQGLLEAHRRIFAAFEGIAEGTEALALLAAQSTLAPVPLISPDEVERLRSEIDEERMANAQLVERVRALKEREESRVAALEGDLGEAQAKITALEAARSADRAEIEAILSALTPLIAEAV